MNVKGLAFAAGLALALQSAPAPAAAIEGDETGVRLGLDEALRIALENNLDLVIARKNPAIASQRIEIAESVFDSALDARAGYGESDGDKAILDDGVPLQGSSDGDSLSASVGWGRKISFGGEYRLSYDFSTIDSASLELNQSTGFPTSSVFARDQGAVNLSFSLPLLRGFGREVNQFDVLVARSSVRISEEELRRDAHAVLKRVEDAYWDLLSVRAALDVARESLRLAQDLLELNRKKVEVGTLAPIEITQAEAGVASREEGVILAQAAMENAEDVLRRLLAYPMGDPVWQKRIVPTDAPELRRSEVDLDGAIRKALETRPEMIAAKRDLENLRLGERVARRGLRHGLDLNAAVGQRDTQTDLALDFGGAIPPNTSSDDSDDLDWSVEMVYTIPLRNRAAKANFAVASLNREKGELGIQNLEHQIRVDVRVAVRNVESSTKRVEAAQASTVLQRKKLEAEQKKFENGMSTSFEVLTFQTDLANAQLAEIRARLDYMKSLADLERAQGTMLEARGLRLDAGEGR